MATIPPVPSADAAVPTSTSVGRKSPRQAALEEALAVVKSVTAGNARAALTQQIRDQRAAAAQETLGRAQERYKLLRETMLKVLAAGGDPRSAVRLAREAAAVARDVAKAVKDIALASKGGDPETADARRAMLDGLRTESHKLLYGVRSIVDAARIVNDYGDDGLQQSRRAREINRARRDTQDALASVTRELANARQATRGGVALEV